MPRGRPPTVGEHGRQESVPTRSITGRRSISTIERRVRFKIVKVGDGLGETFGNFVGRLAATLAVLTGESYRLREKRQAGLFPSQHHISAASEEAGDNYAH